jgi:DHA2 family multidrug resistance protein
MSTKAFKLNPVDNKRWYMTWREWAAVLGAALGAFIAILDIQITNASLREIQGALGLDMIEGGWISTSYLIAEICIIPLTSYFSEVFGLRRYILVNTALFILASVLCGCAWNLTSMIGFRVLQGIFGGTLIPMAFQVMLIFMPQDKRPLGMAIFGLTATLAPTLGPSLGGWLTDTYGWRTIFFINVLPGILMIATIRTGLPTESMILSKLKKIDFGGIITLILGLGCLTYILEDGARLQWFEDRDIQVAFLISLISLSLFVAIQILREHPLLNLRILLDRNFGLTSLITMMAGAAIYGGIYALSMYLSAIQNYTATDIGSIMMWVGIPQLFVMPLLPFLMRRMDLRLLAFIGLVLFAASNYLNSFLDYNYAGEQFRISLIIRAIGQPLFLIPLSTIGIAYVSPKESGNAAAVFNMLRNLGGSIGIALAGTFMISRQTYHYYRYMEHYGTSNPRFNFGLSLMEMKYRQSGVDILQAKSEALKTLVSIAVRDSYIQSFSDIFAFLSLGLALCLILVFFMKKVDMTKDIHFVE